MEDPIQRHPTRIEQLDILAAVAADAAARVDGQASVLDLGCGTGYFAHRLAKKLPACHYTGVDLSTDALHEAAGHLASSAFDFSAVTGDLRHPETISLPRSTYDLALTCLTFHDLTDVEKQAVFGWVAGILAPGGMFFVYDRIRLEARALFPLQQSIWARIEEVYGRGMRSAADFDAYRADIGEGNDPGRFEDYFEWYRAAGFEVACLHLHGNVALFAGAKS